MTGPWTFQEAAERCQDAARAQEEAENRLRRAWREYAEAEETYRVALSRRILEFKEQGIAMTVCADLARGEGDVAEFKRLRDIAEGAKDAAEKAAWRHNSNRKDIRGLADWSARREIAEGYGQTPEPEFDPVVPT